MEIQFLGAHHFESKDLRFVCFVIDDVLAIDAGSLASSLTYEAQENLKAILLTHSHYDHVKDVPAVAMNHYVNGKTIHIYATHPVYETLVTHFMNGQLYPNFTEWPEESPTLKVTFIEAEKAERIDGYEVLPLSVNHEATVGFQVTSSDGKVMFYTSDTGPDLAKCWEVVQPQLLIIDVTMPNSEQDFASRLGHLTPKLLEEELTTLKGMKGFLPRVIAVHMNPAKEKEIEKEIREVAKRLDASIVLAHEGMQVSF